MRACTPRTWITLAAAMVVVGTTSPAQAMEAAAARDVAHRLADAIVANYVEPDVAARAARMLRRQKWPAGSHAELAGRLTEALQPFDGHFAVGYRDPSGTAEAETGTTFDYAAADRFRNFGFHRVELLRGNVGYIDLRQFANVEQAGATAAAAVAMVANAHGVIVDLRRNGGGDPAMVQLLCSYFLPPRVHLNSLYWRPSDTTTQFWTLPFVPGARLEEMPLYVLIGPRTASAAEEFANNMRALERATLFGARTYGAANPGDRVDLGDGWWAFISTGKAINPVTGGNWEGTGVEPHEIVSNALAAAHERALATRLEQVTSGQEHKELLWAHEYIQATNIPTPVAGLAAASGRYQNRQLILRDATLFYQRAERPVQRLVSTGPAVHYLADSDAMRLRVQLDDDGNAMKLTEEFLDGSERSFKRRGDDP